MTVLPLIHWMVAVTPLLYDTNLASRADDILRVQVPEPFETL